MKLNYSKGCLKNVQNTLNSALFSSVKGEAPYGRPLKTKGHTEREFPAPKRIRLGVGMWEFERNSKKQND